MKSKTMKRKTMKSRLTLAVLLPIIFSSMPTGSGCASTEVESSTPLHIIGPETRVAVLPLSPWPGTFVLPGTALDGTYFDIPMFQKVAKEQWRADMDVLQRSYCGFRVAKKLWVMVRMVQGLENSTVDAKALERWEAYYLKCIKNVLGSTLLGGGWTRTDPPTDLRQCVGLNARKLAEIFNADLLLWGDVSCLTPKKFVCRIQMFDKTGRVVWMAAITSRDPLAEEPAWRATHLWDALTGTSMSYMGRWREKITLLIDQMKE